MGWRRPWWWPEIGFGDDDDDDDIKKITHSECVLVCVC